jgi:hypothetical protein
MRLNWRYAFLLAAIALLETGLSIWMIGRLNRNDPPLPLGLPADSGGEGVEAASVM